MDTNLFKYFCTSSAVDISGLILGTINGFSGIFTAAFTEGLGLGVTEEDWVIVSGGSADLQEVIIVNRNKDIVAVTAKLFSIIFIYCYFALGTQGDRPIKQTILGASGECRNPKAERFLVMGNGENGNRNILFLQPNLFSLLPVACSLLPVA
ncbi:MAG: hypothetical protein SXA11_04055 [Cyanobacteriota bacterium]|nr:hypothetical protein [Cyanobacteriota bacterium]